MTEWRPVVGWEGFYEVSDDGQVRSLERTAPMLRWGNHTRRVRARTLRQYTSGPEKPYRLVRLCGGGRRQQRKVHVLVAEAFLLDRSGGPQVLHWDDNEANNHVSNLRWGTGLDNARDRVRNRGKNG